MTVTSKLHTQEYRDIELNIVVDDIGPGEGGLDSGGIEIPLKPAGKGGMAHRRVGGRAVTVTARDDGQTDDDGYYYYIRWRLKLEGETENMGVCTKERKGVAAAVLIRALSAAYWRT